MTSAASVDRVSRRRGLDAPENRVLLGSGIVPFLIWRSRFFSIVARPCASARSRRRSSSRRSRSARRRGRCRCPSVQRRSPRCVSVIVFTDSSACVASRIKVGESRQHPEPSQRRSAFGPQRRPSPSRDRRPRRDSPGASSGSPLTGAWKSTAIIQFHAKCATHAAYRLSRRDDARRRETRPARITSDDRLDAAPGLRRCSEPEDQARDREQRSAPADASRSAVKR